MEAKVLSSSLSLVVSCKRNNAYSVNELQCATKNADQKHKDEKNLWSKKLSAVIASTYMTERIEDNFMTDTEILIDYGLVLTDCSYESTSLRLNQSTHVFLKL